MIDLLQPIAVGRKPMADFSFLSGTSKGLDNGQRLTARGYRPDNKTNFEKTE